MEEGIKVKLEVKFDQFQGNPCGQGREADREDPVAVGKHDKRKTRKKKLQNPWMQRQRHNMDQ